MNISQLLNKNVSFNMGSQFYMHLHVIMISMI